MKYRFLLLTTLYVFVFNFSTVFATGIEPEAELVTIPASVSEDGQISPPEVVADSAILIDGRTGQVLFDKNMHKRQYPASITKIMTTLLAIEQGNLDDTVTTSQSAVDSITWDSSKQGVLPGERMLFMDALYSIMLKSANDVSVVIAEHIAGSQQAYAQMMTQRAQELGAINTQFTNAHGLFDENHYVTAADMALIAMEAIKHQEFREIISTNYYEIPPTNLDDTPKQLPNRHKMVTTNYPPHQYPWIIGGKTGYTDESRHTLVSFAEKNGVLLICVVLSDPIDITYTDTKALFDYGFDLYQERTLFYKTQLDTLLDTTAIPVFQEHGDHELPLGNVYAVADDSFRYLLRQDIPDSAITKNIILPKSLEAPIYAGDTIGRIEFTNNHEVIGEVEISARNTMLLKAEDIIRQERREEFIKETKLKLPVYLTFVPAIILLSGAIIRLIVRFRRKRLTSFSSSRRYKLPRDRNSF